MNVVRLFPVASDALENGAPPAPPPVQAQLPQPQSAAPSAAAPPASPPMARLVRRRGSAAVGILSGGRLTPAGVIARALDRPPTMDSFWAIWLAHQDALRQRSLRLTGGNRADAEDALSNTMLRAAQAYLRQPVQNPGAWLVRILHNACMDQHRQKATQAPIEGDVADTPPTAAPGLVKAEPSPEEALSQAQLQGAWREAMAMLPPSLADPLRLHLDDWSDDEIALHLQITRELVRKRRQLAKERLRALLRLDTEG